MEAEIAKKILWYQKKFIIMMAKNSEDIEYTSPEYQSILK